MHQFVKFIVDRDAQRLERARRRMHLARLARRHAGDHRSEHCRRGERRRGAVRDDGVGDTAGRTLLAEMVKNIGQGWLPGGIDKGCGSRSLAVHAHIERAIGLEGKAARRVLDLHGRLAHVEHNSVEIKKATLPRRLVEPSKSLLYKTKPPPRFGHEPGSAGNCGRVAIERENLAVRFGEQSLRIAAGAESGVKIKSALARSERGHDFVTKHGNVPGRSASGEISLIAAARYHSRAPCGRGGGESGATCLALSCFLKSCSRLLASARCTRKRPGSQI